VHPSRYAVIEGGQARVEEGTLGRRANRRADLAEVVC
jgi:hypothetical protein